MKFYNDKNMFFEPILLTITSENQALFLNDNDISLSDGTKLLTFNDMFKALIALKTKPLFYTIWLNQISGIIYIKKYNTNFEELDSNFLCFNEEINITEIENVFLDSFENNLYLVVLTEKNTYILIKITEELKYTLIKNIKKDIELINIETISTHSSNWLMTTQRPGTGLSATVVGNKEKVIIDKYHCYYREYVVYSLEKENTEEVIVMNISTFEEVLKFEFEEPIITVKMLDNNKLVCLLNKEGLIEMAILNIISKRIIKSIQFRSNIELHSQVSDKILIKNTSLSNGISWGYINKDSQIKFPVKTLKSVDFINVKYIQTPSSCILFEPKNNEINRIIISIHGGPESFEFDELRYNGIYREFVYAGVLVCVLNYNGSAYRTLNTRKSVWKNWHVVIKEILECSKFLENEYLIPRSKITLLGVSFGATLGLITGVMTNKNFEKIIAIAPLMNLKNHVNKLESKELIWFNSRFNNFEINKMFNYRFFQNDNTNTIYLIQGNMDSVLDYNETLLAYKSARINKMNWNLITEENGDHVPSNIKQKKRRYQYIYQCYFNK